MNELSLIRLNAILNGEEDIIAAEEKAFLSAIDPKGEINFLDEVSGVPAVFLVQTGGSEPRFLERFEKYPEPYIFLVTGTRNSLAASLEMLSYCQARGKRGKIIMGEVNHIREELLDYISFHRARKELYGLRLGTIGSPSDWLIASDVDQVEVRKKLGIVLVDVPYDEFLRNIDAVKEVPEALFDRFKNKTNRLDDLKESLRIYMALKKICEGYELGGFTLRCFDLLNLKHQTSCLAFGLLNEEGILAGCEGDVPALLTMALAKANFGYAPFMANPSCFQMETNTAIYAHCTLPLDFAKSFSLDTHFESGLGFGIRGEIKEGPVTCFKLAPDLSDIMALEGEIISNPHSPIMCRSQIEIKFASPLSQIIEHPYGNHMIFAFGKKATYLRNFYAFLCK